uniref:Avidin n=1 Tax=Serinus canaria TaxID=9135 RepID=A0A8C9MGF4_SERCA
AIHLTAAILVLVGLQLQPYKGRQVAGLGGALSSLAAMGRSAFDNRFSGFYLPGPAAGYSELLTSPLEGSQQDTELISQPTFSFTVNWKLQDSETARTSVFLGQCYVDTKGEETLHALWLLREAADSPAEDWKGTRIGTSTFTRIK